LLILKAHPNDNISLDLDDGLEDVFLSIWCLSRPSRLLSTHGNKHQSIKCFQTTNYHQNSKLKIIFFSCILPFLFFVFCSHIPLFDFGYMIFHFSLVSEFWSTATNAEQIIEKETRKECPYHFFLEYKRAITQYHFLFSMAKCCLFYTVL